MGIKVIVGMSGGVDSSVAALLLKEQGYDVTGVTLKLRRGALLSADCFDREIEDAARVAGAIGIPHTVLDFSDRFSEKVVDYFVSEYENGRTPNPCVACNKNLKFGALFEYARKNGFDYLATGHYARIEKDPDGSYLLSRADSKKDQSYVLYFLSQEQLAHVLFPLGTLSKEEIRSLAAHAGLPVAKKPDSQEICFIRGTSYSDFLASYTGHPSSKGEFIDAQGNVLGFHQGITHYTIGQRKGLGINFPEPRYVIKIDAKENRITLGKEGQQYASSFFANNLSFPRVQKMDFSADVKVRYLAPPVPATIHFLEKDLVRVDFSEPQRSVTPGQTVVFYDGNLVLGGGTIL